MQPDLPIERVALGLTCSFNHEDTAAIAKGFTPNQMEAKWAIGIDGNWLIFRRSWTGYAVFGLLFRRTEAGSEIIDSWASRKEQEYGGNNIKYERKLAGYLIDSLLLNKPVNFPRSKAVPAKLKSLHQHHIVGRS